MTKCISETCREKSRWTRARPRVCRPTELRTPPEKLWSTHPRRGDRPTAEPKGVRRPEKKKKSCSNSYSYFRFSGGSYIETARRNLAVEERRRRLQVSPKDGEPGEGRRIHGEPQRWGVDRARGLYGLVERGDRNLEYKQMASTTNCGVGTTLVIVIAIWRTHAEKSTFPLLEKTPWDFPFPFFHFLFFNHFFSIFIKFLSFFLFSSSRHKQARASGRRGLSLPKGGKAWGLVLASRVVV